MNTVKKSKYRITQMDNGTWAVEKRMGVLYLPISNVITLAQAVAALKIIDPTVK